MKKQHLTIEQATLLGKYELTGSALFEALEHIEGCEICRLKVPTVASETVIRRLSSTELPAAEVITLGESKKPFRFGWNLGLGFAVCLIGLFIGIYYFIAGTSKDELASNKNIVKQPVNVNSLNANEQIAAEPDKEEKAEIKNNSLPNNEISPKRKSSNLFTEIAGSKTPEVIRHKQDAVVPAKEIAENRSVSNRNISIERSDLEKFLIRIPASIISLRPNFGGTRSGNTDDDLPLILSPNGEVVRETQPNLSWSKAKDAAFYQVSVTDKTYKEAVNEKTTENNLKVKNPLKRGQTYIFTVTAEKESTDESNQKTSKPALFKVASEKAFSNLERAEKRGEDWNILSVMVKEGMLGEAEKKLNSILSKNPKDRFAIKLLHRIRQLRLTEAAD